MTADQHKSWCESVAARMVEIGKPANYAFGQGDASWAFLEAGFWMVTRHECPKSIIAKKGSPVTYYMWPH